MSGTKLYIGFVLLLLLGGCGYFDRSKENVGADFKLFLPTGATYQTLLDSVAPHVENIEAFKNAASSMRLKRIYPGRYTFRKGETNKIIIDKLLTGKQDEIDITVGNYNSIFELSGKLDPLLETSAAQIIAAIARRDEAKGLDSLQWIYFLAPNTYRFNWTQTPDEIIAKIALPYQKYWTAEKRDQLNASGLTELQATTLASIVQLESYQKDEQPRVAGLYFNRLKLGMKLDADPTVIFAKKQQQGTWTTKIERVYFKDLRIPSPYNTYVNKGLPPGPVCMPNPSAMDAVLAPQKSDFIYFVADPSRPGYHLYAKTLAEQEKNAAVYRNWVKQNNIQ
ncbi:MAG: endolytic transglycosylase MltG [Sphingobacteriales bacterium]|nr:MAG: endolytic transglycosylase MltG [Sphingobacteriales bacterium]